ncbi:MAG: KEOPS complex subunit Pcc1 [Halobacteria archaeon]|nr:KEOPS complex subunit Pcc1 [Halobacteria archaeon]
MKSKVEFETYHDSPEKVALSVSPDNTDEMETEVNGSKIVTRIERDSLGSLLSTADDYVRNIEVAAEIVDRDEDTDTRGDCDGDNSDIEIDSDNDND